MDKTNATNYLHRIFLGWIASEIAAKRVSKARKIDDMAPIDLTFNHDLFERFLTEENQRELWNQLQREHGSIEILSYDNR